MPAKDIRYLNNYRHGDIAALNFIRNNPRIYFRRHHRRGLRSQIVEVLRQDDVQRERAGVRQNGIRRFPRARPKHILRLFRQTFFTLEEAHHEARAYEMLARYLDPDHMAPSCEFIVDYHSGGERSVMLCGLQQYIDGVIFDPWAPLDTHYITALYQGLPFSDHTAARIEATTFVANVIASLEQFCRQIDKMLRENSRIPDLAGFGNLILTAQGGVKLVDINNVSTLRPGDSVLLDDQNYPSGDKSLEVLILLEEKLLRRPDARSNPFRRQFLNPDRTRRVTQLERRFYEALNKAERPAGGKKGIAADTRRCPDELNRLVD